MSACTVVPITFFGIAALGLITQPNAMIATKAVLLALLFLFGFLSRHLSGAAVAQSFLAGILSLLLGSLAIQIKVWTKVLPTIGT
jgi:hypothetical protein